MQTVKQNLGAVEDKTSYRELVYPMVGGQLVRSTPSRKGRLETWILVGCFLL